MKLTKVYSVVGGLALLSLMTRSEAQLWSNGDIVTHPGIGSGGNDVSAFNVDPLTTTFGLQSSLTAAGIGPVFLADDFTPIMSLPVRGIRIPWYITIMRRQICSESTFGYMKAVRWQGGNSFMTMAALQRLPFWETMSIPRQGRLCFGRPVRPEPLLQIRKDAYR